MAWSAPRTWASGEIPTAAQLNTDLRDNLNELSRHAHGGGSGSGTAALGNLVSMTFIDAAAPAAPGGTLTRVYSSSTGLFWRNAGGIYSASTAGHEHSVATASAFATGSENAGSVAALGLNLSHYGSLGTAGTYSTYLTQTATYGGTGSRAYIAFASISIFNANVAANATGTVKFGDGANISTTVTTWTAGTVQSYVFVKTGLNQASGSGTWVLEVLGSALGGSVFITGRSIFIQEVRQA